MDLEELFAPFTLRIAAGPLSLRVLRDEDFGEYAALLRRPVFEDEGADHVFPWYAVEPEERARNAVQFQWRQRAGVSPTSWSLPLGVFADGALVGTQDIAAEDFTLRRTVTSGSWLTQAVHGRGWGRLMRQAMLVLAFDHLGALRAESEAVLGNERSLGVSRTSGYVLNGTRVLLEDERIKTLQKVLVTPETFRRPEVEVEVSGLTPALRALLGADG